MKTNTWGEKKNQFKKGKLERAVARVIELMNANMPVDVEGIARQFKVSETKLRDSYKLITEE